MNFITLVQETRNRVGIQGIGPSSVDTNTYEAQIVSAVEDSWLDIQNYRPNWKWMRESEDFLVSQGVTDYTPTDVFGPNDRLRYWLKDTFYITVDSNKSILRHVDYDNYVRRHNNDTVEKVFYEFTIRPQDNALIFPLPDQFYTIDCDYQKTPQEFTADADIPEMPPYFHKAIIYGAVSTYAASIEFYSVSDKFEAKRVEILGGLMREQNPREKLKVSGIA